MELKCCRTDHKGRPECAPIFIPKPLRRRDSIHNFRGSKNQACIPFTRSTPACNVGEGEIILNLDAAVDRVREQFNAITAFLDMSSIYASDKKWQTAIRTTDWNTRRCQCKSRNCHKRRMQRWCPGALKENKREKGLPTREEVGTTSDFMAGESGEFQVSSAFSC